MYIFFFKKILRFSKWSFIVILQFFLLIIMAVWNIKQTIMKDYNIQSCQWMASNRFCETTRAWLNINVRVYRVYTYFISDPHYFLRSKSSAEVNNIRKAWRTERSSVVKLRAKLFDRRHIRGYMRNNFLWDLCFQKKALTGCIQRDEGSFTKPVLHTFLTKHVRVTSYGTL